MFPRGSRSNPALVLNPTQKREDFFAILSYNNFKILTSKQSQIPTQMNSHDEERGIYDEAGGGEKLMICHPFFECQGRELSLDGQRGREAVRKIVFHQYSVTANIIGRNTNFA